MKHFFKTSQNTIFKTTSPTSFGLFAFLTLVGNFQGPQAEASVLGECTHQAKKKAPAAVHAYVKRYCLFTSKDSVPSADAETLFSAYRGEDLKAKALRVRESLHRHYKDKMDEARAQGKDLDGQCEAVAKHVAETSHALLSPEKQTLFQKEQGLHVQRYTDRLQNLKKKKTTLEETKKTLPADSTQHPALLQEHQDIQAKIEDIHNHLKELGIHENEQGVLTPKHPRTWDDTKDLATQSWTRHWTNYCRKNPISAGLQSKP